MASDALASGTLPKSHITNESTNGNRKHNEPVVGHEQQPGRLSNACQSGKIATYIMKKL